MKRWFWSSIAIVISTLPLLCAGDVVLSFKAGAHQRAGIYREYYGNSRFTFGGTAAYELARYYRSSLFIELDANFERSSQDMAIEHIAGTYAYQQTLSRSGFALRARYEYNFSKDGISIAAGLQRDFEKEVIDGQVSKQSHWRPVLSLAYEINLSRGGRQRIFLGSDLKFNVDEGLEAGIIAGLKMSFNLFRKFEG